MIGSEFDRLVVARNGRLESSHLLQHLPTIEVSFGTVAFQRDSLLEIGKRLIEPPKLFKRRAAVGVRKIIGWIELDRFITAGNGLVVPCQLGERQAAAIVRQAQEKTAGREFDRLTVARNGRLAASQLPQDIST